MKTISVIIPVYNCAAYLSRCLTSILNNSYQKLQVICVDDGSTDTSLSVMNCFAQEDSRVTVIHQENKGVSAARNAALKHAIGSYVAFVDADDWIHERYFELLCTYLEKYNADVVVCDWKRVGEIEDIQGNSFTNHQEISHQWLRTGGIRSKFINKYIWGRLFRKDIIEKHEFPTELSFCEDRAFNIAVLGNIANAKILYIQQQLYFYVVSRPDSAVNTTDVSKTKEVIWWFLRKSSMCGAPANALYLTEGFSMMLSLRCHFAGTSDFSKEEEQTLILYGLKCLAETPNYPFLWRIIFEIQGRFPFTYDLLRKSKSVKKLTKRK